MSTLDQVTELLSQTDAGIARARRRFRRGRTLGYVCFSLLALGVTVAGAFLL